MSSVEHIEVVDKENVSMVWKSKSFPIVYVFGIVQAALTWKLSVEQLHCLVTTKLN